jgi:hypothetical protein
LEHARGFDKFLYLNLTDAETDNAGTFNDTAPSSSVIFSVELMMSINASSGTYIAYCFAEKKGFSKFGSYTGWKRHKWNICLLYWNETSLCINQKN